MDLGTQQQNGPLGNLLQSVLQSDAVFAALCYYLSHVSRFHVLQSSMCSNDWLSRFKSLHEAKGPPDFSAHKVNLCRLPRPQVALQFDQDDHCISQGLVLQLSVFSDGPSQSFGLSPCKDARN